MINAICKLCMLSDHDNRNLGFFQKSSVLCCDHRTHKNNPVYRIILEQTHIFYFLHRCIIRSCKQHLVITLWKNFFNSSCDPADWFRVNLRHNHTDQTRFLCPEHTRLRRRLISRLFDHFFNLFFLLVTYISTIQISWYCCAGYPCQFGNFFDRHLTFTPPVIMYFHSL